MGKAGEEKKKKKEKYMYRHVFWFLMLLLLLVSIGYIPTFSAFIFLSLFSKKRIHLSL